MLKSNVDLKAKELLHKDLPFDVLCWELAELQLIIEKGYGNYTDYEVSIIKNKIFKSLISYDEICWLISTLECFIGPKYLYPQKKIRK